jgi:two-component system KDP operon response regulator KdpE
VSGDVGQLRILLVEDDDTTRGWLARDLASRGYRVDEAADVASALARWDAHRPDAILLDLGLPDRDGIAVVRRVRREAATPILIVSARGEEASKVEALEQGADDYLTKPFGTPELHARLRAVLRRAGGAAAANDGRVRNGEIVLDGLAHLITVHEGPIALAPREFELLRVLLDHPGRLVTRGRILRAVWGTAYDDESHYIHVYVSQLRRKLARADPDGCLADLFVAEPGVGYRVRSAHPDARPDGRAGGSQPG